MRNKQQKRGDIYNAADAFSDAIQKTMGEKTRVGVFYIHYDAGEDWTIGIAGNMNTMERIGALKVLAMELDNETFCDNG